MRYSKTPAELVDELGNLPPVQRLHLNFVVARVGVEQELKNAKARVAALEAASRGKSG